MIATTQFEETDARRAFPCFDEPDRKAVFSVTLDAPAGMLALSNGAEVCVERARERRPAGALRRHDRRCRPTSSRSSSARSRRPSRSTSDGVAAARRPRARARRTSSSRRSTPRRTRSRFFRDYFALPYPGDKVDLVALPDFAAGAMENLGCITFREAILLADPGQRRRRELERLAEVVEHELAHMWFGDLVTMRWWNGIWLNEAFATFMALRCLDDYRPEWDVFTGFARSRAAAFAVDGLHATRPIEYPVRRPDEAAAMFDVLTYEKGASVLWMLEQLPRRGPLPRRRAPVPRRAPPRQHRDARPVDALQAASLDDPTASDPSGGVPAGEIMDTWIFQGGHPLVTVAPAPGGPGAVGGGEAATGTGTGTGVAAGAAVTLDQEPFSYLPEADFERLAVVERSAIGPSWLVPVLLRAGGDPSATLPVVARHPGRGRARAAGRAGGRQRRRLGLLPPALRPAAAGRAARLPRRAAPARALRRRLRHLGDGARRQGAVALVHRGRRRARRRA